MPKRSNNFQKLIYLIHHQLANEAIVTESKFLHDRAANIDREVDIVIETFVGDYPLTISIECQGRGRVANVEWVEQMKSKHESLPTDKLILVSQSGFTEAARTKAKSCGIETMTMGQATRADWNLLVGKTPTIQIEKWGIEPAGCIAILEQSDDQINKLELDLDQDLYTEEDNGLPIGSVREAISIIIDSNAEHITEQLKGANPNEDTYTIFQMEFSVPRGTYIVDTSNVRRKINSLVIIGHSNRETELIDMEDGSFGSAQIAFGKTKTVDAKSLVTIVEHEEGPNTAAILLPSDKKDSINIVDLREAKRT
jgi:hypothetical protein